MGCRQEERVAMADAALRRVEVREKAVSAAGAAFVSAVIVNPLDVAKTRLQAQEAGVSYQPACAMKDLGSFKVSTSLSSSYHGRGLSWLSSYSTIQRHF